MIEFNDGDCTGCGQCVEYCTGVAFIPEPGYGVRFIEAKCLLCDRCEVSDICPGDAVKQK